MRGYCATAETFAIARHAAHQLEFRQYSDDAERCGCNLALMPGATCSASSIGFPQPS